MVSLALPSWTDGVHESRSIPIRMLPKIVSSSEVYGTAENEEGLLVGVKIAGILGDQQVAPQTAPPERSHAMKHDKTLDGVVHRPLGRVFLRGFPRHLGLGFEACACRWSKTSCSEESV